MTNGFIAGAASATPPCYKMPLKMCPILAGARRAQHSSWFRGGGGKSTPGGCRRLVRRGREASVVQVWGDQADADKHWGRCLISRKRPTGPAATNSLAIQVPFMPASCRLQVLLLMTMPQRRPRTIKCSVCSWLASPAAASKCLLVPLARCAAAALQLAQQHPISYSKDGP